MIHVQRDQTDEVGRPVKPSDAWFQRAAVATQTAIEQGHTHEVERTIYADDEVRMALERLFHDKCAYCESKMTASADWDVEHFRPHGRVAEREDHPGYYWLGYTWENLYASCQHCNQRRRDRRRWEDSADLPTSGKADQFPLMDEGSRAMGPHDDVHAERRLLIDPCLDDPEDYLGYIPTGEIFSLRDPHGSRNNDMGTKTIDVLHLMRRRLRVARRVAIKLVSPVIAMVAHPTAPAGLDSDLRNWLKEYQEHAGVVRYVVRHSSEFGI